MSNSRLDRKKSPKAWRRLLRRMIFIKEHRKEFARFVKIKNREGYTIGPGENKELSVFCSIMREKLKYSPRTAKCDIWHNNYMLYLEMKKQKII